MKLTVDFSALRLVVNNMGATNVDFELDLLVKDIDPIAAMLETGLELGKDIQLSDISSDFGVLSAKGQQLMLYIPDQGSNLEEVIQYGLDTQNGKKVHVAECTTLRTMRAEGRFPRYDVISRSDGKFPVFGYQNRQDEHHEAQLRVCKNCLTALNYKGYSSSAWNEKQQVFDNFNYQHFFETYSSHFKSLPGKDSSYNSSSYTEDWPSISARIKAKHDSSCQQCGVNLESIRRLLHVHHISGVKTDNRDQNLRSLCADCHKKQPRHEQLFVKHQDILAINVLRKQQSKFDVHNYQQLISYADTALEGLLKRCESNRLAIGELGVSLSHNGVLLPLDLAWPRSKVAVFIDPTKMHAAKEQGWNVFTVNQALVFFSKFQRMVR